MEVVETCTEVVQPFMPVVETFTEAVDATMKNVSSTEILDSCMTVVECYIKASPIVLKVSMKILDVFVEALEASVEVFIGLEASVVVAETSTAEVQASIEAVNPIHDLTTNNTKPRTQTRPLTTSVEVSSIFDESRTNFNGMNFNGSFRMLSAELPLLARILDGRFHNFHVKASVAYMEA